MSNMLDYLKLLNSPLYTFLTNHTRVKYLITFEPLPDIRAKILPINRKLCSPATPRELASVNTVRGSVYLAEQTSVVKPHLTKTTLLNNSVYVLLALNGNKSDFYIGSASPA